MLLKNSGTSYFISYPIIFNSQLVMSRLVHLIGSFVKKSLLKSVYTIIKLQVVGQICFPASCLCG